MALPSFFRTPQHKVFNYAPRYYDERKERREERIKEIKREMGIDEENGETYRTRLTKGSMRSHIYSSRSVRKKSNIRTLLIAAFLILILYFFFLK